MSERRYANWGRLGGSRTRAGLALADGSLPEQSRAGWLPYGNGRSYGDTCLNDAGVLLDMRSRSRILRFDERNGVIEAEAGTLLRDITRRVAPSGWFLPVTPGTQFVTLGGALANDVHGKNHHRRGTFGAWVREFRLLRSDRGELTCSPGENADLFSATIGGMGLTGLVTRLTLQLMRVPSMTIRQTTMRFGHLSDYFAAAEEADARHEYAVAWIDSLASGRNFGRGHLICGDHADAGARAGEGRAGEARAPLASIPLTPPISPLRGLPLRAFNELYFRKAGNGVADVPFDGFFYPLDRIRDWNRLYGPKGLHQHQSVVPLADAPAVVRALMECAARYRQGSFLTVLKRFGDLASPGLLSFPRPGYTLTLDFPHLGPKTLAMLRELDAIAIAAGGAVNPYKDARMAPETFAASFPNWRALEALRDPAAMSDFWRRTAAQLVSHRSECDESLQVS